MIWGSLDSPGPLVIDLFEVDVEHPLVPTVVESGVLGFEVEFLADIRVSLLETPCSVSVVRSPAASFLLTLILGNSNKSI